MKNTKKFISPFIDLIDYSPQHVKDPNTWRSELRLNHITDADIIKKFKSVPNKHDYIRQLVRADLKREREASK